MTKEQVLAYLKALEQQEVRLEEGEFTTSEYAESEGIKMGAALKRLKVMEKKAVPTSRRVKTGSTRTRAWKLTDQNAQKGKGEKKK